MSVYPSASQGRIKVERQLQCTHYVWQKFLQAYRAKEGMAIAGGAAEVGVEGLNASLDRIGNN